MANKRDLKKDINYSLGSLIEEVYLLETTQANTKKEEVDAIVDDAIETFDSLMTKVNQKNVEKASTHFKGVRSDLKEAVARISKRIEALR